MVQWEEKPRSELERMFVEGYERLVRAGRAFDAGQSSEAPNIAKEVMTFAYDRGTRSESILCNLGLKDGMDFADSAKPAIDDLPPNARLLSNEYCLIHAIVGFEGMAYRPLLGRFAPKRVPFNSWWEGTVLSRYVARSIGGRECINRGELIQHIRNEEGGGHVSAHYKRGTSADKLARLMQGEYVDGYIILNEEDPMTAQPYAPAYATVRQIGWELEETLRWACPELVARADFRRRFGPKMRPVRPDLIR